MPFKLFTNKDSNSEQQIINRIHEGDEQVLEVLYKQCFPMISKMITHNNGTLEDAMDIAQDAVVIFWQKAISGTLVMSSKITTYIYGIGQNLWLKELERKRKFQFQKKDRHEYIDTETKERDKIIIECIDSLDKSCRDVLIHYYYDEMSMAQIAERMGLKNTDSVKTKKYKCKQKLEELVKSRYSESDFLD